MYEAMLFIMQYLYVHFFVLFLIINHQCMAMNHFKKLVLFFCHTESVFLLTLSDSRFESVNISFTVTEVRC